MWYRIPFILGYILVRPFKADTINNLNLSMKACGVTALFFSQSPFAARLSLEVSSYINTSGIFFFSPSLLLPSFLEE